MTQTTELNGRTITDLICQAETNRARYVAAVANRHEMLAARWLARHEQIVERLGFDPLT